MKIYFPREVRQYENLWFQIFDRVLSKRDRIQRMFHRSRVATSVVYALVRQAGLDRLPWPEKREQGLKYCLQAIYL